MTRATASLVLVLLVGSVACQLEQSKQGQPGPEPLPSPPAPSCHRFGPAPGGGAGPTIHVRSGRPFSMFVETPGAPAGSVPASISIESSENPAVLGGATTVDTVDGVAWFDELVLDRWGEVRLLVSSPGLEPCGVDVEVRASEYRFLTQPSSFVAGQTITVQVGLTDVTGSVDPLAKGVVTWLASGGTSPTGCPETVSNGEGKSPVNGVVTFDNVRITTACRGWQLQLGDGWRPSDEYLGMASAPFDVVPGPPTALTFLGPSSVTRGATFVETVRISDPFGNPVPQSSQVELALVGSGVQTVEMRTPVDGIATFAGLSIASTGPYTLTARVNGIPDGHKSLFVSAWEFRSNLGSLAPNYRYIAIAIDDPNTVYASSGNPTLHAQVSRDGGRTWTSLGVAGLIVTDPVTPSVLYAISRRIYKTTNGGTTWTDVTPAPVFVYGFQNPVTALVVAGSRLFANSWDGIWRSDDGGTSWVEGGPPFARPASAYGSLAFDQVNNILYTTTNQLASTNPFEPFHYALWKSLDFGTTWTQVLEQSSPIGIQVIDPFDPSTFYGFDRKSIDAGQTWQQLPVNCQLAASPSVQGHLLAACYGSVRSTMDGGATWSAEPPAGFYDLNSRPVAVTFAPSDGTTAYSMSEDGVYCNTATNE